MTDIESSSQPGPRQHVLGCALHSEGNWITHTNGRRSEFAACICEEIRASVARLEAEQAPSASVIGHVVVNVTPANEAIAEVVAMAGMSNATYSERTIPGDPEARAPLTTDGIRHSLKTFRASTADGDRDGATNNRWRWANRLAGLLERAADALDQAEEEVSDRNRQIRLLTRNLAISDKRLDDAGDEIATLRHENTEMAARIESLRDSTGPLVPIIIMTPGEITAEEVAARISAQLASGKLVIPEDLPEPSSENYSDNDLVEELMEASKRPLTFIPGVATFTEMIRAERIRQIGKGYNVEHDEEHGVEHLLELGIDFARQGKDVKAGAMMIAAVDLLRRQAFNRQRFARFPDVTDDQVQNALATFYGAEFGPNITRRMRAVLETFRAEGS